ncbi:dTDP-4-dehydrorhamnose 3,5-epimerase-like enzyme [Bradyrhizobium sp. USDA 4503]
MKFHPPPLTGAYTIVLEKRGDHRGFSHDAIAKGNSMRRDLSTPVVKINDSLSAKADTLRGMHYQLPPAAEVKIVRFIRGAQGDAIIDLLPDSLPTVSGLVRNYRLRTA